MDEGSHDKEVVAFDKLKLMEEALILGELFKYFCAGKKMSGRTRRAEALILVLLILLGIIVIFALLSTRSARVRLAPLVQEVFWRVDGQRVETASLGQEVEAHLVVKATEEYVGSIVLKIRKDISFWPDSDYSIQTVPVSLRDGQEAELKLEFVPDQASAGSLRGYFVEVDFSVTGSSWVMENSYPPRLKVT